MGNNYNLIQNPYGWNYPNDNINVNQAPNNGRNYLLGILEDPYYKSNVGIDNFNPAQGYQEINLTDGSYGDKGGGSFGLDNGIAAAAGVTSLATDAVHNSRIPDTTPISAEYASANIDNINGMLDIINSNNQMQNLTRVDRKDLDMSNGERGAYIGSSVGKAALTGAKVAGPWGAAIGAVIGGLTSGISSMVRHKRALREAKNLQQLRGNALARMSADLLQGIRGWKNRQLTNVNWNNMAKEGGFINMDSTWIDPIVDINAGGTHEENPNGGVLVSPNASVEEGESIVNLKKLFKEDGLYVMSDTLKISKDILDKYNLKDITFAEATKKLKKEAKERPNDLISLNGLQASMQDLIEDLELIKAKKELSRFKREFKKLSPEEQYMAMQQMLQPTELPMDLNKLMMYDLLNEYPMLSRNGGLIQMWAGGGVPKTPFSSPNNLALDNDALYKAEAERNLIFNNLANRYKNYRLPEDITPPPYFAELDPSYINKIRAGLNKAFIDRNIPNVEIPSSNSTPTIEESPAGKKWYEGLLEKVPLLGDARLLWEAYTDSPDYGPEIQAIQRVNATPNIRNNYNPLMVRHEPSDTHRQVALTLNLMNTLNRELASASNALGITNINGRLLANAINQLALADIDLKNALANTAARQSVLNINNGLREAMYKALNAVDMANLNTYTNKIKTLYALDDRMRKERDLLAEGRSVALDRLIGDLQTLGKSKREDRDLEATLQSGYGRILNSAMLGLLPQDVVNALWQLYLNGNKEG